MTSRIRLSMALVLVVAALVSWLAKPTGISGVKGVGLALALLAFVPVFVKLTGAFAAGNQTRLLVVFVGGFLYKLLIVVMGVWLALVYAGWDALEFTVACLSFLFAFQVCEALWFWGRGAGGLKSPPNVDR